MAEPQGAPPKRLPLRHVVAVASGNALAFYDFLAYAYFAVQIGRTFFPESSPRLLLSLATFAAGFLTRPIGALVIGRLADRVGRRPAMMLSFTLMGIAIVGVALTPSYAMIGISAPILVLTFRMLLGFALGGEVGPTTAYLLEAAPPARRGLYASLQAMTQDIAAFASALVGFGLASVLSDSALDAWGWRVAMLIGATVVPVGLMIRRNLPETLHEPEADAPQGPVSVKPYLGLAFLGLIMLAAGTMASYVQTNLTAYASDSLHMATQAAFGAGLMNGFSTAAFDPIGGWLSDKYGRKPIIIAGAVLTVAATLPAFFAIVHFHNAIALYSSAALLGAITGIAQPPVIVAITEALPKKIRAGTLALVYALAISVFGGMTPFAVTWLIKTTGNPMAPAWYMVLAAAAGLVAMVLFRETAPRILARRAARVAPAAQTA